MSRKTDSPGFNQVPGTSYQHCDIPMPASFSLESPTSSASSPCPDKPSTPDPSTPRIQTSLKGVENAKKRLRAFSIQKKTSIAPTLPKVTTTGTGTVLIGKLCSAKVATKPIIPEGEKVPKPPKPGKCETYSDLKKKTLEEIEDMKRKMELVELGIPLGLVLPPSNSEKGMPTKAMPPIKSFLDNNKVDELIREAKKAKAEGKEFKFDYQKLLPGYDNPFQRKAPEKPEEKFAKKQEKPKDRFSKETDRRSERGSRRFTDHKKERDRYKERGETERSASVSREKFEEKKTKDDRDKHKGEKRSKDREHTRDRDDKANPDVEEIADKPVKKENEGKETKVNLNDYLVCDSWSLDNETASPKVITDDYTLKKVEAVKEEIEEAVKDPLEKYRDRFEAKRSKLVKVKEEPIQKIEKLQPVDNSFTYEIDPDDEAMLDMFDEDSEIGKFTLPKKAQKICIKLKKELDLDSQDSKDTSMDFLSEEFLESVIKEIKQENLSEDDVSQDKGLVEYDMSPLKEESQSQSGTPESRPKSGSTTPEIKTEFPSQRSQYSESGYKSSESGYKSTESEYKSTESGYKSTESGYKSTESGYKSTENCYKSTESSYTSSVSGYKSEESVRSDNYDCLVDIEKEAEDVLEDSMSRVTRDSLETWSFVMKICQPLLFRHDRNKCYRETNTLPKLWFTENPRTCDCVKDRTVVYGELETCKMTLVNRVYGCDQVADYASASKRDWYPCQSQCLVETTTVQMSSEWEMEDNSQSNEPPRPATPVEGDGKILDMEYQRFIAAVYPEAPEPQNESRSNTPTKEEQTGKKKRKKKSEGDREEKKAKKMKLSNEGWSLGSDFAEHAIKSKKKLDKEKGKKRKLESATISDSSDDDEKKKKGLMKKSSKSHKSKAAKRRRLEKKYIKKLKSKQKRRVKKAREKLGRIEVNSEEEIDKTKKSKKKKQQEQKKKEQKKKKPKSSSSSDSTSSSSSDSESDTDSDQEKKKKKTKKKTEGKRSKKKKDKKKKRKYSTSESTQSDDLFDVDILNNIKTEKNTDDKEVTDLQDFSPRRQPAQPRQEIINVKELQNDLVTNNIHIKQEILDSASRQSEESKAEASEQFQFEPEKELPTPDLDSVEKHEAKDFKEPQEQAKPISTLKQLADESNHSQGSSQESVSSLKEQNYEKDESHLRPSSQNSNYSFHDVMSASQGWKGEEGGLDNYEMYERMAMEYQSGVASQQPTEPTEADTSAACRIETVVSRGSRGEIKCDWRPGDAVPPPLRPSRWGLKPGDVNIVLTGSGASDPRVFPIRSVLEQDKIYPIESISSRGNDSGGGYDEAYADMYAASDRLQYGDCFTEPSPAAEKRSLDARIEAVLNQSANDNEKSGSTDKGSANKEGAPSRPVKRVSFADGYKPGQDSDTEEPPVKKRKKRRLGCPWPCPATHPDHVPLWDALPPPPPPPGSPPPPPRAPPLLLPRGLNHLGPRMDQLILPSLHHHLQKFDPSSIPGLLPPEPPPGMLPLPRLPI